MTQARIHRKLKQKQEQITETKQFNVEVDDDMVDGLVERERSRNVEVHELEADMSKVLSMFVDLNAIIKEDKPKLDAIEQKLAETSVTTASGDQELIEAEEKKKSWCVIL